jgi:uncharacterized protein (TIGR00369 family)
MGRNLSISWEDPVASAARAARMTGLEALRAIMAGELPPPPIALLLGMEPVEVSEGCAVFAAEPDERHLGGSAPYGRFAAYPRSTVVVHGGLAATLLDSAMGCAVQTTLPAGAAYTTLELKVNFTRPITRATGRVLCRAAIVHRGGRVATAEGRVVAGETGKLLAHGTTTCLILSGDGPPVAAPSGNGQP